MFEVISNVKSLAIKSYIAVLQAIQGLLFYPPIIEAHNISFSFKRRWFNEDVVDANVLFSLERTVVLVVVFRSLNIQLQQLNIN